jgi:hypothetical protein
MRTVTTAEAVIRELGGIRAVAELAGVKYVTAHHWKAKGSFPPRTHIILTKALAVRQLMAPDELFRMIPVSR